VKRTDLAGKRVVVMGLGGFGGGIAAARWLASQGATVIATDQRPAEALSPEVRGLDAELRLGGHDEGDFTSADLVVASPAVPPHNAYLRAAERAGVPITTEIALVVERLPTRLVFGVTGTKGKSTTAAVLAKMLSAWRPMEGEKAGKVRATRSSLIDLTEPGERKVWLGGNLGGSLLFDLPQMTGRDFVVLELSSYMLHHLDKRHWSPHVAVVTMIGTDHLAWHGSREAYVEAKRAIVRHQTETDFAVVPQKWRDSRQLGELSAGTAIEYGKRAHLPAAFAAKLPGKHNRINERGAYAAAALVGVYPDQAAEACADFAGLPHRLELVQEDELGRRWVNDSIATIPEAAIAACTAFAAGEVVQIVGGSDKGLPHDELAGVLGERCRAVLCIGETGPALAAAIGEKATVVETLERAVAAARDFARAGDVVLLAPGTASYDQFTNFQERGERFRVLAVGPADSNPPA